jgi:hypothetical protein
MPLFKPSANTTNAPSTQLPDNAKLASTDQYLQGAQPVTKVFWVAVSRNWRAQLSLSSCPVRKIFRPLSKKMLLCAKLESAITR